MPKDGRRHEAALAGYYANHGKSVDAAVSKMGEKVTPMMQVRYIFILKIWPVP